MIEKSFNLIDRLDVRLELRMSALRRRSNLPDGQNAGSPGQQTSSEFCDSRRLIVGDKTGDWLCEPMLEMAVVHGGGMNVIARPRRPISRCLIGLTARSGFCLVLAARTRYRNLDAT